MENIKDSNEIGVNEYSPWELYNDINNKNLNSPHKEFIEIGQYACGEGNKKNLTSDEKKYFQTIIRLKELSKTEKEKEIKDSTIYYKSKEKEIEEEEEEEDINEQYEQFLTEQARLQK